MPKYAKRWRDTRVTALKWIYFLLEKKLCQNWIWVVNMEVRGEEGTPVEILTNRRICIFVPLFSWGDTVSEVVETGLGVGVTVSREQICYAALHSKYGIVDIFPGCCLKVGH